MTQSVNIQIPGQTLAVPLTKLLTLLANEELAVAPAGLPAAIGSELQGGIYVGPMVEDGQLVHLIAAKESLGCHEWEAAKVEASRYKGGGFLDWRLPTKDEATVALVHAKSLFDQEWHWTSTERGSYTWAVDFEFGLVGDTNRGFEFRVRPFRRLSI
ncbi:DUF1566 domain-containing protein [Alcaligenes faecalis]|uniref:DUF1566 domain-containing protein n=1 Tax=Alcaligenes faecalis TaxID=511 RepID=UPI00214F7831|nr:DUF1566 domain-containing protein [Alcaligenes faecalis]MCR4144895.1 DUF1566 domain-containing protein [Alcaligenes faecalis]